MTNVESMDYTHSHPSTIASLSNTAHFSLVSYTITFLKTATIPTYYGISIAIPRYIVMQLSTVPLLWHASSLSYCFAWSCSWHRICGKATVIILSYMSLLIHCISWYTAGGIHIYLVLVLSCNSIKVWWSSLLEHCPKWGKDDGDYDSPTSRYETSDFIKIKEAKEAHKKEAKEAHQIKKWEKKREGTMLLSFFHTFASK